MQIKMIVACAALVVSAHPALANAQAEPLDVEIATVEKVGQPHPHWLVVNDSNFLGYMDSKVYLVDTDANGELLGMLSTGGWHTAVELAPGFKSIVSPETYYSRGNYGERTDVLTFYDVEDLSVSGEVVIPARRGSGAPHRAYSGMSDDGRFVYVVNMTPAMSISVVNATEMAFATEIDTAGCTMVYPTGNRSLLSLCGNGSLLRTVIDDKGAHVTSKNTDPFFNANEDPITEKAARIGNTWYFVTFSGEVIAVEANDETIRIGKRFRLTTTEQYAAGWRPGGGQFVTAHPSGRLYVAMNSKGDHHHKDAGEAIWVFDVASGVRTRVIEVEQPVAQLAVSQDAAPILAASVEGPMIYLFDGVDGSLRNTIQAPLLGAGILQFARVD